MLNTSGLSLVGPQQFPITPRILHVSTCLCLRKVKGQNRNSNGAVNESDFLKRESQDALQRGSGGQINVLK